jgi:hypothetical protein
MTTAIGRFPKKRKLLLTPLLLISACSSAQPREPLASVSRPVVTADQGCALSNDPSSILCVAYDDFTKAESVIGAVSSAVSTATWVLQQMGVLSTGQSDVQALQQQFDTVAGELNGQFIGQQVMQDFDSVIGDMFNAQVVLQKGGKVSLNDPLYNDSERQTIDLASNTYYSFRATIDSLTAGPWKNFIQARPPTVTLTGGEQAVYDWRVLLPVLMEAIAMRLTVIGAVEPRFVGDSAFAPELGKYHDALHYHRNTILEQGIQCGYGWDGVPLWAIGFLGSKRITFNIYCADIFSGTYVERDVSNPFPGNPLPQNVIDQQTAIAKSDLYQKLPMFALQASLDGVSQAISGGPDLTQSTDATVRVVAAPNLCLDTAGGSTAIWTPLVLASCNRSHTQRWHYDRVQGTLVHLASGLCAIASGDGEIPGTPAVLDGCGHSSARWSYTPNSALEASQVDLDQSRENQAGLLTNANGDVLDTGGRFYAGAPVQLWPRNLSDAQHWMSTGMRQAPVMQDASKNLGLLSLSRDLSSGSLTAPFAALPPGASIAGAGDFNGDGEGDILWRQGTNVYVWTLHNGQIVGGNQLLRGNVDYSWIIVGTGDFNGDGITDVVWRGGSTISIWLVQGPTSVGGYTYPGTTSSSATLVYPGDFDGDGTTDLMLYDLYSKQVTGWRIVNGNLARSGSPHPALTDGWSILGVGDFDGDGRSDIVLEKYNGDVGIWLMANESTIATYTYPQNSVPVQWSFERTGDFDGDGVTDIFWKYNATTAGEIGIWKMRGGAIAQYAYPLGTTAVAPNMATAVLTH